MVHINELRITVDRKFLIIDVSVRPESYFDDIYLSQITIDNQDSYKPSGSSQSAIKVFEATEEDKIKSVRLVLNAQDLKEKVLAQEGEDIDLGDMLFVYIAVTGTPSIDIPCDMDTEVTMATVVDLYPFYQQAMEYVDELAQNCTNAQGFTDFILRQKALEYAIKTGNYPKAIEYYNNFLKGKTSIGKKGGCGCGRS